VSDFNPRTNNKGRFGILIRLRPKNITVVLDTGFTVNEQRGVITEAEEWCRRGGDRHQGSRRDESGSNVVERLHSLRRECSSFQNLPQQRG